MIIASTEYAKYLKEGKIIISVKPKNADYETTLAVCDNILYRTPSRTL
ncbi:hypothetical protein [uncultured Dokdonia sp.]|nr:hypothetical protein [uncultured Dokdonia sp.]